MNVDGMIEAVRNATTLDAVVVALRGGGGSGAAGGGIRLYHGTARGNTFSQFDPSRAGSGVGKNHADQGDRTYLTESLEAAKWFAEKAEVSRQLMNGGNPGLNDENPGTVLAFTLDASAKVLHKLAMPRGAKSKEVIQQAIDSGFDAIAFPDQGFNTVEGDPRVGEMMVGGAPPTTYIILNEAKLTAAGEVGETGELGPEARGEAGRGLTPEQRRDTLATLVDVYREKGLAKEPRVSERGEEYYAYPHSPDLFETSDITGRQVRYHVTLPDGRRAHPTELFPDLTEARVEAMAAEQASRDEQAGKEIDRHLATTFATMAEAVRHWDDKSDASLARDGRRTVVDSLNRVAVTDGERVALVPGHVFKANRAEIEAKGWRRGEPGSPANPFEASAIKDASGNLLTVYHGTEHDFEIGEFRSDGMNAGFFFTDSRKMAEGFAGNSGKVFEVNLAIQNPIDLTDDPDAWELFHGGQGYVRDLQAQGYDGAIFIEPPGDFATGNETVYVAFDKSQIRAAEPLLSTYSETDLAERERAQQAAQDAEQQQREEAERRAKADRDRDDFRLTGSDSASDVAASYGQSDMLGATMSPAEAIDAAAAHTDTTPSPAQAEAGNYRKGRITFHGLDIAVENPRGSTRRGAGPDGAEWESTLAHHYGDIKGTTGADGDNLDVFIGNQPESTAAYIVDQINPDGSFDEHKIMLGFDSLAAARAGYLANYEAGWQGLGEIAETTIDNLKAWLRSGDTRQPYHGHRDALAHKEEVGEEVGAEEPDAFPGPKGREMEVRTAKGTRVSTQFTVIEAADLIASHTPDGRENAAFPQELQPRDRSRDSSRAWIQKIAKDLDPGLLGKTKKADSGAPIIGPDRIVESGNGRTLAIMEAYRLGRAGEYKAWLIEDAASYGLNPSQIAAMEAPVLVRVRTGSIDRAAFAVEANQDDKLAMTATEKAKADANRLTPELMARFDPGADGDLLTGSNRDFIMGFLRSLGDAEAAQYLTSTGDFTGPLIARVQAAVFAKAYEDERLLELMADSAKPENRNIISALSAAAPEFIQARAANAEGAQDASERLAESVELSLESEAVQSLIDATNIVRQAKREGMDVGEYVSQMGLFGDMDPGVAAMAVFIAQNNRSAKRLSTAFKAMAEFVRAELERNQAAAGDMFGDAAKVSMADVVEAANRVMEREYGEAHRIDAPSPGGLFEGVERIRRRALRDYLLMG